MGKIVREDASVLVLLMCLTGMPAGDGENHDFSAACGAAGTTFQTIVVDSGLRPVDTARIEIS